GLGPLARRVRVACLGTPMRVRVSVGDEGVWRRAGDRGGDDVAGPNLAPRRSEVDQPAVAGAPGHADGAGGLAALAGRHQQADGTSDLRGVLLQRDLLLKLDESLITLLDNGFRDLTVEVCRGGAWPLGVLEGERAGEPRLGDDVEGGREVVLGLAGEPD